MTQAAIITAPAPVLAASEQGEPTIEELSALLPSEAAAPVAEVAADGTEPVVDPAAPVVDPVVEAAATAEADAAAERANKAAARAREGSRRYAATQAQLREQAAIVQRAARDAEQLRYENAQARQRDAELKRDPYKALKGLGMTDADLAARAMRENTPEALLEQERQERISLAQKLEAMEQRLVNERKASHRAQEEAKFTALADNEASFPRLSQLSATAQLAIVKAALSQVEANGYPTERMTNEQVAEICEQYLAPKRAPKAAPVVPVVRTAPKPSGKTLTNALAQTRAVAPAAWDSLSEEQQLAHIAASLPDPTS